MSGRPVGSAGTRPAQLLHAAPAAGFDEPFEMLLACHDRVRRSLTLLRRIGLHVARAGCDEQARSAAADVQRYFDVAAPLHHEDEEKHLLPALQASGDAASSALAHRLHEDHRRMAQDWSVVREDLNAVRAGTLAGTGLATARRRWSRFAAAYLRHIAAEEAAAIPPIRAQTSGPAAAAMGSEMATRRGVRPPPR